MNDRFKRTTNPPDTFISARNAEEIAAAEEHVRGMLRFLGEDPQREGLLDTPARVVLALAEQRIGCTRVRPVLAALRQG